MKRGKILILIFFCLQFSTLALNSDYSEEILDIFAAFRDNNTGLTIFPTLVIPMGGNYEGMGTAYTALANDTGFIEANPAGSASLPFSEVSVLHHNYISDVTLDSIIYTNRIRNWGFGVSGKFLLSSFEEKGPWGQPTGAEGYFSETIASFNVSYNFLSSYDFNGIALGANLKAAYRGVSESIRPGQSLFGVMGDVGVLTRFDLLKFFKSRTRNFAIGGAVKNVGFPVSGEPLPTMITAGIAYSFITPITLAVDFNQPVNLVNPDESERWYLAGGMNVIFAKFFSMQMGMRIKENPYLSIGFTVDMKDKTIIANYNLDLSSEISPVDKFSLEAKLKLNYTEQEALRKKKEKLLADGLASLAEGNYEKAISSWEEILAIDPSYTIAQRYIDIAKKSLELPLLMEKKQDAITE